MHVDPDAVSVTDAAALAGLPRGTVASWRHRGHVPADVLGLPDALSLVLAGDLHRLGLRIEAAAAIGRLVRGDWQRVIAESPRRFFLAARLGEDGRWVCDVLRAPPPPPAAGLLQVDLSAIARRVLEHIAKAGPRG